MKDQIKLGKQIVGPMYKPFLIADMSANHNGSLKQAYKIIDSAKKFGVDAIKLQSFTPDTMTIDISKCKHKISVGKYMEIINEDKGVDKIAKECGTISREILTSISQRVKRVYL